MSRWKPLFTWKAPSGRYQNLPRTESFETKGNTEAVQRGKLIEKILKGSKSDIERNFQNLIESDIQNDPLTLWIRLYPYITLSFLKWIWIQSHDQEGSGINGSIPDGFLSDGTPVEYKSTIKSIRGAQTKWTTQVNKHAVNSGINKCLVGVVSVSTITGQEPAIWLYTV